MKASEFVLLNDVLVVALNEYARRVSRAMYLYNDELDKLTLAYDVEVAGAYADYSKVRTDVLEKLDALRVPA